MYGCGRGPLMFIGIRLHSLFACTRVRILAGSARVPFRQGTLRDYPDCNDQTIKPL